MKRIFTLFAAALIVGVFHAGAAVNIIPKPTAVTEYEGAWTLPSELTISYSHKTLASAAGYLEEILAPATGYGIKTKKGTKGDIRLVLTTPSADLDESYTLLSGPDGVTITSASYKGIIHGISTLRQLLPYQIECKSLLRGVEWKVPAVENSGTLFLYRFLR